MSGHLPRQSLYPGAMPGQPSSAAPIPNPALPIQEQLMQLDQAITLTLQEIDQNFASAHQIVTSRILPAVNRYGVASARTWQGAKFWKHFFEVSANVSLSARNADDEQNTSYEHSTSQHADSDAHTTFASDDIAASPRSDISANDYVLDADDSLLVPNAKSPHHSKNAKQFADESGDASAFYSTLDRARASSPPRFSNASMAAAARREADKKRQQQQGQGNDDDQPGSSFSSFDPTESPFERLRRDLTQDLGRKANDSIDASALDAHQKQQAISSKANTATDKDRAALAKGIDKLGGGVDADDSSSSPVAPPTRASKAVSSTSASRQAKATPKGKTRGPLLHKVLNSEQKKSDARHAYPKVEATPKGSAERNPFAQPASVAMWNGIVDLRKTPLNPKIRKPKRSDKDKQKEKGKHKDADTASEWDSEDDNDSFAWPAGMSPPVTMQFSVPQSKYAKTPAKEAARLMVEDLLKSVGASRRTGQPHPRAPLAEQQVQQSSDDSPSHGSALRKGPLPGAAPRARAAAGTPLRRGKNEAERDNKRRDSMPTPPTVTKRGPSLSQPTKPRLSTTPSATPSAGSLRRGPADVSGTGSAAAMLMDEGEGLDDDEDEDEVPENLGTKLSAVALNAPGGVDRMLPPDEDEDDDDDDEDDDDDSFDEDEEDAPPASAAKYSNSGQGTDTSSGWTSSTISSFQQKQAGRSIEDDTLFGVPKPQQQPAKNPFANQDQNQNQNEFKPWGQVDEMGTVHGGRPLVDR